jgi:hypothetical protein
LLFCEQRRVEALLEAASAASACDAPCASSDPLSRALPALVCALSSVWPGLLLTLSPAFDAALSGDDARRGAAAAVLGALFAAPRSAAAGEYRPLFGALLQRFRDRTPAIREAMARWAGAFLTAFEPRREPGAAPAPDTPDGRARDDGGAPVAEVCACLDALLLDFEPSVRGAAGAAVTAAAATRPGRVGEKLLMSVRRLLADKKLSLRRDALRGLACAYAAYVTRDARDAPHTPPPPDAAALFDSLPGALLLACAADGELGRASADALLDGGLVPHTLSPQAAAAAWLRARAAADAPGAKAMDAAMRLRAEPRNAAAAWLCARRALRTADTDADPDALDARADAAAAGAGIERALAVLARSFPAPHDALASLRRLHGARDGHIFRALEALLAPDVAVYGAAGAGAVAPAAAALRTDALRRLGAKHAAAEIAKALCVKLAPAPLDAASVSALFAQLNAALSGEGGGGGDDGEGSDSDGEDGMARGGDAHLPADASAALALLACAAAGAPAAFASSLPALLPLLSQRRRGGGELLDGALRILLAASPALRGVAGAPSLRAPLTSLATSGSVPQAKRAAACLVALQRDAAPALAAGLADALPRLCDDALAPALGALGALAAAAPEAYAPRADAVTRFVTRTLLPRTLPAAQRGAGAGRVSDAVALKVRGVLALARACCPITAAVQGAHMPSAATTRAVALTAEVLEPLLRGTGALFSAAVGGAAASSADGVALRAAASRAMLKLARARHDASLPPSAFAALAAAALDPAATLRAAVLTPLLKSVRARKLPSSRLCALLPLALSAAAADAPDGASAAEARRALAAVVDTLRVNSDAAAALAASVSAASSPPARAPTPAVTRAPEYMLLYLIWALSRHPAVPATPAAAAATKCDAWLRIVQPPLRALCDALLAAPRAHNGIFSPGGSGGGGGGGAPSALAGAALPLLLKLSRQVKLSEDAAEPVHNHALYALADVTSALLVSSARAHGWDSTATTTLTAPMPLRYFTMGATPRLGPLSPAAAAGTVARPRPSASFLPAHFALLPEEAQTAHDGATRAKTPKKRRRAAPRGGAAAGSDDDGVGASDDEDDGESAEEDEDAAGAHAVKRRKPAPRRTAAKKTAKRGGKAATAPAAASRMQPRRGATRTPLLADVSSDDSDEMEAEEAPPPARVRKPAASKAAAASPPARTRAAPPAHMEVEEEDAAPLEEEEEEDAEDAAVMAWSPPPARAAVAPARPAAVGALLYGESSEEEEEDEKDKALNPKPHARRDAPPPPPPPPASPPPPATKAAKAPEPAGKRQPHQAPAAAKEEEEVEEKKAEVEEEEEEEPQLRKSGRRRRRR